MNIELLLKNKTTEAVKTLYNADIESKLIQISKTKKDIEGDYTLVVFPFLKISKKSPEITAEEIGKYIKENTLQVQNFSVIKGFLNFTISSEYWFNFLKNAASESKFGFKESTDSNCTLIEYSSPNTNKPLHLGHIRNNLLGWSVAEILKASGKNVVKVNLVNDRGIHICKSMLAWLKWGNGANPEANNVKGDKLVGDYYVLFDSEYKKQINELISQGVSEEQAKKNAPLIVEAQELLRKWESKDEETRRIWEMMNAWVYQGFDVTYNKLGIDFDKTYYESQTYTLGKSIVNLGLEKALLEKKDDGSIWINLTTDGLDEKLLLRSDGTSVYMTQDLGTAVQRFEEYSIDKHIYVVGNEQNYHFQVLALVLKKLGYNWSDKIYHLSYGMVELPHGKMKSREGTVVDADELIEDMIKTATEISAELGKIDKNSQEAEETMERIALGALKYFILKVDPKKNMLFDPQESIDFNGNTGPFIQYTYARIKSIFRKALEQNISFDIASANFKELHQKETELIKLISSYPETIADAAAGYSPAFIANYIYELAKEYNQFYHDFPILKEEDNDTRNIRLLLSEVTSNIIKSGLGLLGIKVVEKM